MSGFMNLRRRAGCALAVLFLGALGALPGCNRKSPWDRNVWAEVDGNPILREEVERYYRSRIAADADVSTPEQKLSFKLNILDELINNEILVAHASHSGIAVSEAEVDTKVAELQSPYSKEEFQKKLIDQGLDLSSFRQQVRQSLIINKLISKEISSRISISDAEIAKYYQHNKANFNVPETQYHLAQVLVTPVADSQVRNLKKDDAKNPLSAERKIQALYARIRAGEDFSIVAQEYSEDPRTAAGGGDMGFIPLSSLASSPQVKQAVTSLKVGEVSGIIRTQDGYHIVKLLGREEAGQRQLVEPQVQSAIRQTLMNEKDQLLKAAYIENLRSRAKVVNFLAERIVAAGGNPAGLE